MAAVLTNGKGFYDPLVYVLESWRLGLKLLPPTVNEPGPGFTVVSEGYSETAANSRWDALHESLTVQKPPEKSGARVTCPSQHQVLKPARGTPGRSALYHTSFGKVEAGAMLEAAAARSATRCEGFAIRVPLTRAKGLTERTVERLLAERERGTFASLADFHHRMKPLP